MNISKVVLLSLFVGLISSGITYALTSQVQTVKPQKIMTSEPLISPSTKIPFYSPSPISSLSAVSPTLSMPTVNPINAFLISENIPLKTYQNDVYGFVFSYPATLTFNENTMDISGNVLGNKKIYIEVAQNSLQTCKVDCDLIKNLGSVTVLNNHVNILLGAKKSKDNHLSGQYITYEFAPKNGFWTYITLQFDDTQPTIEQTAVLQQITSSFYYFQKQQNQSQSSSIFKDLPVTGKPVIYLYPPHEQNIYVKLNYLGKLLATYPDYDYAIRGWNVRAFPDGKIINLADGQEYSYIFWDGETALNIYDLKKGFVVAGKDSKTFLQQKLKEIGLIAKEYNEFIVYWLPKLQKNEYNLIYFAGEEYTNTAELDIYPKPDSLLRVFMSYKPLKDKINVPTQELKPFVRKGFTVIEWGGREIN